MLNKGNRLALTLIVLVAASLGVTACSDSPGSMRRTKDGKLVPTLAFCYKALKLFLALAFC